MAKQIEYPRASLNAALQLGNAVRELGNEAATDVVAHKLGRTVSGAFAAVIGAAVKFGLVQTKSGKLFTTPLFREIKLAYTADDAMRQLTRAFLAPPLFSSIYERFKNQRLPVEHFEKLLIREFGVPESYASRVTGYFTEGAKQCGLLNPNFFLSELEQVSDDQLLVEDEKNEDLAAPNTSVVMQDRLIPENIPNTLADSLIRKTMLISDDDYKVSVNGPGVNVALEIRELEDLDLVRSIIKKIEKALTLKAGKD
jgi:hypothetical protein